MFEIEKLI